MHSKIKKIIKNLTPPVILNFYFNFLNPYGFKNEYLNWQTAQNFSSGYDSEIILNKTKNALLKIKNNEATYERDSVLFDKIQYSWPLLASLLYVASANNNHLNLLDFGGSLGSTYYQNRNFLKSLKGLTWNIVEQPTIAQCGQENFTDRPLKFYSQINKCLAENSIIVALFSASLQYLSEPYKILDELFKNKIRYILLDRLTVNDQRDLITVQNVNPIIYKASYPLWIFKEKNILDYFIKNNYELITDFDSLGGDFVIQKIGIRGNHKGYLFKFKNNV
ncbi:methyltransferase, TIGR04325 family [Patescibacteria group bacterium]|nr:methyltransferase, TIGR04325 family [Patescibacteria group bacterium]MBU1663622.1 methyltransferase, TIGR04325 family [Patescibacteria group bacterium]MBU1933851.1 methyltransferase, TIGR04325 family [Patescibacteria group bacterium]MBU2007758.1 methyltransferase, TIGR04325 family [Patescibacteria group bacterium]MBU2233488.1 methyltransferase, TIGR04325 family [Patescibacteria group bacterium]